MVRKEGKLVYKNKWGYSDLESNTPIEYNSIYRFMSMSKCITGIAVLKLYEAGKIDLDAPVSVYIPEFANSVTRSTPKTVGITDKSVA